jgi:hypothetical protein
MEGREIDGFRSGIGSWRGFGLISCFDRIRALEVERSGLEYPSELLGERRGRREASDEYETGDVGCDLNAPYGTTGAAICRGILDTPGSSRWYPSLEL